MVEQIVFVSKVVVESGARLIGMLADSIHPDLFERLLTDQFEQRVRHAVEDSPSCTGGGALFICFHDSSLSAALAVLHTVSRSSDYYQPHENGVSSRIGTSLASTRYALYTGCMV